METAPAAAWGVPRLPPRFEFATHFSPASYERIAAGSLYLDGLARQIAGATYTTALRAVEKDLFIDDVFSRDGELVILEVDAQVATAFASRYYVDISYPTDKLHVDGFGRPEWGRSSLTVRADTKQATRSLTLQEVERAPVAVEPGTVSFRGLGDNDAVLLYFHPDDLQGLGRSGPMSMRIEDPDREIEALVNGATEIMGQPYVMLSQASFKTLRDGVPQQDIATEIFASASGQVFTMALGKLVFRPLFGAGATFFAEQASKQLGKRAGATFAGALSDAVDGFERTRYNIRGRQITARTLRGYGTRRPDSRLRPARLPERRIFLAGPTRNANALLLPGERPGRGSAGILGAMQGPQEDEVELLGVQLPPTGTQERTALDDYLRQVLRARNTQFVRFQGRPGEGPRGVVFVSDQKLVLNVELLRQGLVRLDTRDPAVAATFPELASAAREALRDGTGFAARWRDDAAYRRSLLPVPRRGEDVWGGLAATESRGAPRPDLRECLKFVRHVEALTARGSRAGQTPRSLAPETRVELVRECRERGVQAEIVCALNSRSMDELAACGAREDRAARPYRDVETLSRP